MKRASRFGLFDIWLYIDIDNPSRVKLATSENYIFGLDVFWAVVHRYQTDPRHVWVELIEHTPEVKNWVQDCFPGLDCTKPNEHYGGGHAAGHFEIISSETNKIYEIACNKGEVCKYHGRDRGARTWQDCPIEQIEQLDRNSNTVYEVKRDGKD
jgi:hypothetical protein